MNTRYCEGSKQPCPHPYKCGIDCRFNTAELPVTMEPGWLDAQKADMRKAVGYVVLSLILVVIAAVIGTAYAPEIVAVLGDV